MSKYPYKRVMVTGGAGFIGSSFIQKLAMKNEGTEIVNLDNLSYAVSSKTLELLDKIPKYSHINLDITQGAKLESVMQEFSPDLLINFAAESHVDNSIDSALPFINTNIIGTFNLLESARKIQKRINFYFITFLPMKSMGTSMKMICHLLSHISTSLALHIPRQKLHQIC